MSSAMKILPRPQSTYRLQFHANFTFADAAAVTDYLADLGVTHAYASPYLAARAGSTHGYDVIDHCRLNPEVGARADFDAWVESMRRRGMSHILDTVPNHVGVGTNDNRWWNDVLAHGPASRFANYFDITWQGSPRPELHGKVLLPVLGAPYGQVLEKGELKLKRDADGALAVYYYDHRFPIDPATAPADPEAVSSSDALHELLERQHYRLSYWRVASDEINYRRFFDINDLAALSMEREEVFEAAHGFIFELLKAGTVAGLRIDHPDGLYDPKQYFERLQRKYARDVLGDEQRAGERPLYAVAEKILAIDEPLPESWPCDGTSGYDFLIMATGRFVDAASADAFTRIYDDWTGEASDFEELVYRKKKLILEISLASELRMLAHQLDRLAQRDRRTRDFTFAGLHAALREVIACFPVYRSYVTAAARAHEADVRNTELAVERAIARNPKSDPSAFRYVADVVLLRSPLGAHEEAVRFAGKFQQVTAPTTAKGIEDTAFYLYNRLISLNEVGGEPQHFGVAPAALHEYLASRQRLWPHAMSATSTHDTKRSEDVRARINVLSEMPEAWRERVTRWGEINAPLRKRVDGLPAPSRNDEYLLYQTLIGAWPMSEAEARDEAFAKRITAYMIKAMREAKVFSSWTSPNEAYEGAVTGFAAAVIAHRPFLDDFLPFQRRVSRFGLINSLAQTLLKIAAPGVPDTYQGTELIDLSLVDPDNRRPVDYARRRELLDQLRQRDASPRALLATLEDGRAKLYLTWKALIARRDAAPLFTLGDYLPAEVRGPGADHLFAFARRHGNRAAVCVIPRLTSKLDAGGNDLSIGPAAWRDTTIVLPGLEAARFTDGLTGRALAPAGGGVLAAADVLADFPVALLLS
ncbi:MAG TPA: malto-oligosyltrehalose synthase [Tepidisphaeraceae bacterium]|nr:malto-oligosyltrehalose synthase [Tepidisphaeraceae bacterium]